MSDYNAHTNLFPNEFVLDKIRSKFEQGIDDTITSATEVLNIRSVNEFKLDAARGTNANVVPYIVRGRGTVSNTIVPIWQTGGAYNWLSVPSTLRILSASAQDDGSGLGAQTVRLHGLDENYNYAYEDVGLIGGALSFETITTFYRLNRAEVTISGTSHGSNYNNLTIQTTAGTVLGSITGYGATGSASYGSGTMSKAIYSVPTGYSVYLTKLDVSMDSTKSLTLFIYSAGFQGARKLIYSINNIQLVYTNDFDNYLKIEENSDFWIEGVLTAATPTDVVVNIELLYVKNV